MGTKLIQLISELTEVSDGSNEEVRIIIDDKEFGINEVGRMPNGTILVWPGNPL